MNLPLGKLLRRVAENPSQVTFARRADDLQEGREFTATELERRSESHTKLWLASGLCEGDRVGMLAVPEPETIAAIVGATRAGLEVALFSPSLGAPEIAAHSGLANAFALAGPSDFAGLDYAKRLAEARAAAGAMNWLMLWETDRPRLFRLDNGQPTESTPPPKEGEAGLAMICGSRLAALDGPLLHAAAGEWSDALKLHPGATIVSLVSPATPAGLAAGVYAPLVSDARLIWQAPFSARRLDEALSDSAGIHLVAPAAIAALLGQARLLSSGRLASLTLIVSASDPTPYFDTDLEPDRVFLLDASLTVPAPLSRFSDDPMCYADGEDLS